MNWLFLIPFTYFFDTRLRNGSLSFHLLFEWVAAASLTLFFADAATPGEALLLCLLSYLAFISVYEIGYLMNDLVMAPREQGGRLRGPQGQGTIWLSLWSVSRVISFLLITWVMQMAANTSWWLFFLGLALVFLLHNVLQNKELKVVTFIWLAMMRFIAPLVFVISAEQVFAVLLVAAMTYVPFRTLAYLDSKSLLLMPGRQSTSIRLMFFVLPLLVVPFLFVLPGGQAGAFLACYFAAVALCGVAVQTLRA